MTGVYSVIGPVDTIDPLAFRTAFISPDDGVSMHCNLPDRVRPPIRWSGAGCFLSRLALRSREPLDFDGSERGTPGVVRLQQFLLAAVFLVAGSIESAMSAVPVGPVFRATLHNGSSFRTHFTSTTRGTENPRASARLQADETPLSEIARIDFPPHIFDSKSSRSVRIVTLWTGESFATGSYHIARDSPTDSVDGDPRPLVRRFGLPGLQHPEPSRVVPIECVASIRPPSQASDLASVTYTVTPRDADRKAAQQHLMPAMRWVFEPAGDLLKPGCHATTTLPEPASAVLASFDMRLDSHDLSVPLIESVQFLLEDTDSVTRHVSAHIRRSANDQTEFVLASDIAMSRSVVRIKHDMLRLRLFLGQGLTVSVDGQLLGSAPYWSGMLTGVRVVSPANAPVEGSSLPPARFRIRRVDRDAASLPRTLTPARDSDCIALNSGDELFGYSAQEDSGFPSAGVFRGRDVFRLTTVNGRVHVPWPDIKSVQFRHSTDPIINDVPTNRPTQVGWLAQLTLAPEASCMHFGEPRGGRLRAVIVGADAIGLVVDHPLLRTLRLPWGMLQRIEPLAFGSTQMLDAGPRHLGNGIREEFSSPEPIGTELSLSWVPIERPDRVVYLSLDAAELIPAGPQTLAASPLLNAVRGGFLATRVEVNGQLIGTLNEHVSIHCPAHSPRRVRIRIPRAVLEQGVNTLRFRQTPAPDDATSFDDCEIRAISIEEDYSVPRGAD